MARPLLRRFRATAPYWAFALFLVLVAGITGSWFVGADLVRERISMAARSAGETGGSFDARSIEVTGFPFVFETRISGLRLTGRTPRGTWEWQADGVSATVSPWASGTMAFDLAGNHKLRFHLGRTPFDLEIAAERAPGEFRDAGDGAPSLVKIAPSGLTVRDAATGRQIEARHATVQFFRYVRGGAAASEASARLLVDVTGAVLPEEADKLLGRDLERLTAEVQVLGAFPVPVERSVLSRWRRDGGALEIKNLDLAWGPTRINGSGTVTLDDGLQPEAAFSAQITGHEKTVDALIAADLIREQDARGIRLVLDMMARRSEPGAEPVIRIPLSIQDRVMYVGPARLGRMPQIRW